MNKLLSTCTTTALLTLATVLVPVSAKAELCGNCVNKVFTTDVGKCARCGAATTSGAFSLCPRCSAANRQCEACRTALPDTKVVTPPVVPPGKEITRVLPAAVTPETKAKVATPPVVTPQKEVTLVVTPHPGINPVTPVPATVTPGQEAKSPGQPAAAVPVAPVAK